MKVVYQNYCDVDVHKFFLVAIIIKTTSVVQPSYPKKRFSTFNNSILQFKDWLLQNEWHDVCMDSTSILYLVGATLFPLNRYFDLCNIIFYAVNDKLIDTCFISIAAQR